MLYRYLLDIGRCSSSEIGIGKEKMLSEHLYKMVALFPQLASLSTPRYDVVCLSPSVPHTECCVLSEWWSAE